MIKLVCLFGWNVISDVLFARIDYGLLVCGIALIQVSLRTYSISPDLGRLIFYLFMSVHMFDITFESIFIR